MTPAEFKRSLDQVAPPRDISAALVALWWAGKDDWDKAHKLVMNEEDADCARVHAYLHRVEGDLENARYWYRRAKCTPAKGDLAAEWTSIAAALLGGQSG